MRNFATFLIQFEGYNVLTDPQWSYRALSLSLGMHFGTFQLTNEGIDEPLKALGEAREKLQVPPDRFTTIEFGETLALPLNRMLKQKEQNGHQVTHGG